MDEMVRVLATLGAVRRVLRRRDRARSPYRGHEGALFRRDYGALFDELFPELRARTTRASSASDEGWDDVTWWLFRRP